MKVSFLTRDSRYVRWQQHGIESLRQVLRDVQRLLALGRPPEALALIPIRRAQPPVTRQRHQRTWRD